MTVDFVRPEVTAKRSAWKLVRDAVAGSESVKAGDYVIEVNPHDASPENKTRNEQRVKRAVYFNATGRTLPALTGIAFGKWPEVQLPTSMDYLLEDADGSGVGLINLSQSAVSEVLQLGRAGLLADYPATAEGVSRADVLAGNARPTLTLYPAEAIINWRTIRRGALTMLGMVVLKEVAEVWDEFERGEEDQWRVLKLGNLAEDEAGTALRYIVQVWKRNSDGFYLESEHVPLDAKGKPWDTIPFTFIGATNNDATPDGSPLYDLADLNIAHFRNSADHEESLFFAGQAMYWISGADEDWATTMQESGVYVGSRSILPVPQGGQAGILQAQAVSGLSEEMKHKVELMAQLGARLIAPGQATRTATEAASDDKTSNSVLSIVCDNVSDAFRSALGWCARFAGPAETEVDFTIGTEFAGVQFDANQMAQVLAAVQAGKLPEADFWSYLRSIGLIAADKGDDEIRDELETQGPAVELDDVPDDVPDEVEAA